MDVEGIDPVAIPGAAEQRARRACLPTGGLLLQQDHIEAWVEPLPALGQCHNQSRPAWHYSQARKKSPHQITVRFWYLSISSSWRSL
jgi:hypothetical protein